MDSDKSQNFFARIKSMVETDKNVSLVANDPALTAEFLLLFRIMLADGAIREGELAVFKRICSEEFGIAADELDGVYEYLADFAYETSAAQSAETFRELSIERRQKLLDHMIAIAEADGALAAAELKLIDRTASMLGFDLKTRTKSVE